MSEGKKFDNQKDAWHLCPLSFVFPLVAVFQVGFERYGFENWKKNFDTDIMTEEQRFIAAIKRHLRDVEDNGPLATNPQDGDVFHCAQIAWNALRLLWGSLQKKEVS